MKFKKKTDQFEERRESGDNQTAVGADLSSSVSSPADWSEEHWPWIKQR